MIIFTSLINLFRRKPVKCCGGKCHTKVNGLPTLAEFEKLPLSERTKLFARWVSEQPKEKEYTFESVTHCPLAQFARAIVGATGQLYAGPNYFVCDNILYSVMMGGSAAENRLVFSTIFGELANAYRKLGLI